MSATLAAALAVPSVTAPASIPTRMPLRAIPIAPGKAVTRVETTRVDFAPGQTMPRHMHPVPVVCFVTRGAVLTRIGEAAETRAEEGSVTYEPPGVVVSYFRNASATAPAQLACAALAGNRDAQVSVMLPSEHGGAPPP